MGEKMKFKFFLSGDKFDRIILFFAVKHEHVRVNWLLAWKNFGPLIFKITKLFLLSIFHLVMTNNMQICQQMTHFACFDQYFYFILYRPYFHPLTFAWCETRHIRTNDIELICMFQSILSPISLPSYYTMEQLYEELWHDIYVFLDFGAPFSTRATRSSSWYEKNQSAWEVKMCK